MTNNDKPTDNSNEEKPLGFDAKSFLKTVTQKPGIYQMYNTDGGILYVGKAKNLKSRLSSYFRSSGLAIKTQALVSKIAHIDVTVTETEMEALLLEQNLIKQNRPPYNILMRDDKSYPYVYVSTDQDFPQVRLHRGVKRGKGRFFGPYPSVWAVRESLSLLQKTFNVRQCEDSFFRNRSRPCLQYQIKRCTAPCVGKISKEDYAQSVRHTELFLEGKSQALIAELADKMEQASSELNFEEAAELRDKIQFLQTAQSQQSIEGEQGDLDIVACDFNAGACCIQLLYVRGGRVLGSKSYYPKLQLESNESEVLTAFLPQFYLNNVGGDVPKEIIISHEIEDSEALSAALHQQYHRQIHLSSTVRTHRMQWLKLAKQTAKQNLKTRLASKQTLFTRYQALQQALELEELPSRMECFDISHSSGEATVASCVVFDNDGPVKADYRRFNIEGITSGDDYAAMHQALTRRYTRLKSNDAKMPDLLIIDGGKGQVNQAVEVLEELQITDMMVIGIAKGTTRKAGFEYLYRPDQDRSFVLQSDDPGLHLLQHIRDEAHRFAITGHKLRRDKKRKKSELQDIPGVGPKRRKDLLRHFGGWQEIKGASRAELAKIPGISEKLADDIYSHLHNS